MISVQCLAIETIVVGEITDSRTGIPLQNANIYYKGTHIGCASNVDGMFMLRTQLDKERTLIISAIGYKTQHYRISPGQYMGIAVELEEKTNSLQEVFVLPGDNPAVALMERVRQERLQNDLTQHPQYEAQFYEHKELYISQITKKHLHRKLWQSLQRGMLQTQDSTFLIPLYRSDRIFLQKAKQDYTLTTIAERTDLFTETDYSVLLGGIDRPINFYHNQINLLGRTFMSPIAAAANQYYKFYITDSINTPRKTYSVQFRTKNSFFATFNGEMTIDSASAAIKDISVYVPRDNALNYLADLQIIQTYDSDHLLQNESLSLILDFAIKTDTSHIFPTVLLKRDIQNKQTITLPQIPIPTDSLTTPFDTAMDSLLQIPLVRVAKFASTIIHTGYIPTGTKVDIGNVTDIIQFNKHELLHIGLPLRTNENLWKNVSLSAYIAYGFKDQAWKGKGQIQVRIPTQRRHILNASYEDHYVWSEVSELDRVLRENSIGPRNMAFTTALFSNLYTNRNAINSATRQREMHIWSDNDWNKHLETSFHIRTGTMGYGSPLNGYQNIPYYHYTSLSAFFRLSWGESATDLYFRRIHRFSRYPILYLQAEAGAYRTNNMQQDDLYARLGISIQQYIPLGMCGEIDYAVQAGIIFGAVPYPMLQFFNGNQTYTFDPYRFTLMNQMQYAADRYILLHATWDMKGFLFNRIPGIQRLRLHELIECKMAYGTFHSQHNDVLPLPTYTQTMKIPYIEAGIGIGNILRVADIWVMGRLTNLKDTTTPRWGIRFRLHISP
ncbi:MAG: DUF5686 and carboxypeptidase regulatory-like domain-containing protein [Prevotella sp.]|nr:DUF5686 and carboxypeptidase regulatory-like domain-containing protein [Prevotella sp.]MCM1402799.1 DUF5686 and carboxypeptidase regulatory-like domain-containing protein [Bacteroides sp.]MCM1442527.1 DUF5686 and carboxypeptidase regulatory-like domain-containing protein [Muribaculum sp.]MCM1575720.1 DUF5686 and carboxypeptidase regulatory-like domain-containing protein [Bacteroides sp.]